MSSSNGSGGNSSNAAAVAAVQQRQCCKAAGQVADCFPPPSRTLHMLTRVAALVFGGALS
jgi:hypothetical protein